MSKKYKDYYLPVEVIIAATQGDAAAIQTVLKTYESYIRNKCIKTVYDERGLVYYGIDTDKKDFMERRLIHAVVENFIVHAVHHKHPALDTLKIIFQRKVKHRPMMDFISPQILPGTDMIGNLSHKEGLADFGRSGKDIRPCVKQAFHHRRPTLIGGLEQLCHRECMQVSGVCHVLHLAVHFFQTVLRVYNFIVAFLPGSGYTIFSDLRD